MGEAQGRAWPFICQRRAATPGARGYPVEEIILPHDDLMERAVLGAILAGHRQAGELLDTLQPADFFNPGKVDSAHAKLSKCLLALHQAGTRPDLLSVHDELTRNGESEAVGGVAYVASLLDGIALKSDV